jgi:hypothetical protein
MLPGQPPVVFGSYIVAMCGGLGHFLNRASAMIF